MELWKYYRILRKRKWLIIVGTLICVSLVLAATFLSKHKYTAYTTVMETVPSQQDVTIFNLQNAMAIDPKQRLSDLAQLVRSREVLIRTAEKMDEAGLKVTPEQIYETLDVTPLGDTTMLGIQVVSDSSSEAQASVSIITREFIKFYNELNAGGTARTKQFIESELPAAKEKLDKVSEELRVYKEQSGAVSLPEQSADVLQRMAQLKISESQHTIDAMSAQAKIAGLNSQLKAYPDMKVAQTIVTSNPIWEQIQMELFREQSQLEGMRKTRTDEHPEVKALISQVAATQQKLKDTATTILNSTSKSTDPVKEQLKAQYSTAFVDNAAAQAASNAAKQVYDSMQPELDKLPEKQMRIAQLTIEQDAAKNTYTLLRQKYDEAVIKEKEGENGGRMQIIDDAQVRTADPKKKLKLIMAIILSPVFCSGIALLLNYLDNTVRTPAEAEELLRLPVFAVVPIAKAHSLASGKNLPAMDASYQMLSTNLLVGQHDMDGHGILVASAEPDVGRSITTANLAITLAKDGARVILVDSDLRQPSMHKLFGVENEKGLSNVLAGQLSVKDALQPTKIKDLLVITAGPLPSNPVRLLRSDEMAKFVSAVNDLADFVVFDSPAGITFPDSSLVAALVKNVIIVHAAGAVPRGAEDEFRTRLDQVGANPIGVVLNMVRPEDSHGYYHFRSAYEELMRCKTPGQSPAFALSGLSKESDEDKGEV